MKAIDNISIVFVCQRGEIEIKSLLLAHSLRAAIGSAPELTAVIPRAKGYAFSPAEKTLEILEKLQVKINIVQNDLLGLYQQKLTGNLVSNKIYALKTEVSNDFLMFLDSDILCVNPKEWNSFQVNADLIAKQANRCEITKWREIYQMAGLTIPAERYRCTVDNRLAPLYLNSGVLWMKNAVKIRLSDDWLTYFELLSQPENLVKHYYDPFFRDQVALSLAIRKSGFRVHVTGENINYPMRVRKLILDKLPLFVHYHDIPTVMSHPLTRFLILDFLKKYDANRMFNEDENWERWLKAGKMKTIFLRAQYKIPRTIKPLVKKPLRRLKVIVSRMFYGAN